MGSKTKVLERNKTVFSYHGKKKEEFYLDTILGLDNESFGHK
jgi:hypothetical protein